jgi:tetratricopeptide (TPR) repeat protein
MNVKNALRSLGNRLTRAGGGTAAYSAGKSLMARGKYQAAVEAFADAEAAFRERLGRSHEWVIQAQAYQAWCYVKMSRYTDATAIYESILTVEKEQPNPEEPRILELLDQLATAYEASGRMDDAAHIRQELDKRRVSEE